MDTGEARWELRTGEGAAVSAGAEQLAGVDMDEVFGPRFAEAVATVAAREYSRQDPVIIPDVCLLLGLDEMRALRDRAIEVTRLMEEATVEESTDA